MKTIVEIGNIDSSGGNCLLRMWQVSVPAGSRAFQTHCHRQFVISMVAGGHGIYTAGGVRHRMEAGDYFVFCSNEVHCITDVGKDGLSLINLQFEPDYLFGRKSNSLTESALGMLYSHSAEFHNRIPAEQAKYLRDYFTSIIHEFGQSDSEFRLAIKSYINLILISLVRHYDFFDSSISFSQKNEKIINTALQYINEHFCEPITLAQVAESVSLSPNYFSHLFHKSTNTRFQDYLNAKRIERSIDYLTHNPNHRSVLEIALSCGFNNTANFNKAFKKRTGVTPSEFLK